MNPLEAGAAAARAGDDCAVRLRGVRHAFGAKVALADISLAIPAGRMCGLIGPDGVGKSTLLSLIAGVRRIQQGEVSALGGDMRDVAHRRGSCARLAYMPQGLGRNLYPTLSVRENLDFFGRLFGQGADERAARIEMLLHATGLDPFPDRPAGKLSGGMKQKLSLCCALIHDPDLLLLDEPTTGVDPLSRRQFWDLIDRLRRQRPGMSVIVATAYMEEAERFDWLAALDDGRITASGSPAEIKAQSGQSTLEAAFVALLPEGKRDGYRPLALPPHQPVAGAAAIEAEGLTCRFGDFTAVDNVSFRIGRGEIFGFLGSNGCGKTTTMKMLTGLLPASAGSVKLFGEPLAASDMAVRRRVGYMSQSFSLYSELTVRQNLALHAKLFRLPADSIAARLDELLARFDLAAVADTRPEALPLGVRQRLQLAVAVLHAPEILILDEPTSGVDPVARESFWHYLQELSRRDGVTIFLSTHFMNEAERCDRVSLMHAGKVLAVGTPRELAAQHGGHNLEEAFITCLKAAMPEATPVPEPAHEKVGHVPHQNVASQGGRRFDPRRAWAYARREATEILRDPLRLAFALLGPLILMLTFGYGISFDVEHLTYAVYDQDQTRESRDFTESFAGTTIFKEQAALGSAAEMDRRLAGGGLTIAIEIPPNFGQDLMQGRRPEIAVWLDGAMPFRADTARGYIEATVLAYAAEQYRRRHGSTPQILPIGIETRFRYNQAFKSIYAIAPGILMLMLALIPAMLTAVGVVREKETGAIANFRAAPVSGLEFLLGKQLPYIGIALLSFVSLLLLIVAVFGVPIRGSLAVLVLGALLYVCGTTGFGVLISSFTRSQVAAIFATAIITIIPAVNFSGLLVPVSSLTGSGRLLGLAFPASWFQQISIGTITKGLGFNALWHDLLMLAGFSVLFLAIAVLAMRKQED